MSTLNLVSRCWLFFVFSHLIDLHVAVVSLDTFLLPGSHLAFMEHVVYLALLCQHVSYYFLIDFAKTAEEDDNSRGFNDCIVLLVRFA